MLRILCLVCCALSAVAVDCRISPAQHSLTSSYGKEFFEFAQQNVVHENVAPILLQAINCDSTASTDSTKLYVKLANAIETLSEPYFIDGNTAEKPIADMSLELARLADGESKEFPTKRFEKLVRALSNRTRSILESAKAAVQHPLCVRSVEEELRINRLRVYFWILHKIELIHQCRQRNFESAVGLLKLQFKLADRFQRANGTLSIVTGLNFEFDALSNLLLIYSNFEIPCSVHDRLRKLLQCRPSVAELFQQSTTTRLRAHVPLLAPLNSPKQTIHQLVRTHLNLLVTKRSDLRQASEAKMDLYANDIAELLEGHPRPFDFGATLRMLSDIQMEELKGFRQPLLKRDTDVSDKLDSEMSAWPEGISLDPLTTLPLIFGAEYDELTESSIKSHRQKLAKIDNPFGKLLIASYHHPRFGFTFRQGFPFRYDPARKLLWSVGEDETDDGGKIDDRASNDEPLISIDGLKAAAKREKFSMKRLKRRSVLTGDVLFVLRRQTVMRAARVPQCSQSFR